MGQNQPDTTKDLEYIEVLINKVADLESRLAHCDSILQPLYTAMTEGLALHEVLFDSAGHPIDYQILEINPAYEKITGLSREQAIGKKASELYGTGGPPYFDIYSEVAESREPTSFASYFPPMDKHFRIHVFSPEKHRFATVFEDISDQVKSNLKLVKSESRFRTITETAQDSIFIKGIDRRYEFVNPAMARLFGVKESDLIGKTPEELFDPESAATVSEVDEKVLKGVVVDEVRELDMGSETKIFHTVQVPIFDDDKQISGICGIVRDVTRQRQLEAIQRHKQKMESIGTLAGGIAHEINNPINIILNFAELIQGMVEVDNKISDYSGEIIKESERIAKIVSNLLTFSRQEQESHSPARMMDIVDSTLSLTHKILEKDGIRIESDIPADLPKCKCRHQQIMQVLMNLITNARDALNQSYPSHDPNKVIRIGGSLYEKDNKRWIRVSVEDSGPGIPKNIHNKIFDPFFTMKGRKQGTGLGLSVSHSIMLEHHGDLSVESSPGCTRFHLDLPVDNGWQLKETSDAD